MSEETPRAWEVLAAILLAVLTLVSAFALYLAFKPDTSVDPGAGVIVPCGKDFKISLGELHSLKNSTWLAQICDVDVYYYEGVTTPYIESFRFQFIGFGVDGTVLTVSTGANPKTHQIDVTPTWTGEVILDVDSRTVTLRLPKYMAA